MPASNASTCEMYKADITADRLPWQILRFLTPSDTADRAVWQGRDEAWDLAFTVYISVFGSVYLALGLTALVLLIKRDSIRMRTKTFFTVYTTIAILGFSRGLFHVLDPYGILGFIEHRFEQWIIVSRFLATFGFPSLVASYTLLVLTLLRITEVNPGKQWYQHWKFVVPVAIVPYVISLGAEIISQVANYPALIAVIVCEGVFTIWGVTICVTFLFAGVRLLREVRKSQRRTLRRFTSLPEGNEVGAVEATSEEFVKQEFKRHHARIGKTVRKITIITYGTAVLGIVYSLVSASTTVVVCLFIFRDCIGFDGSSASAVGWFILQAATRSTEIPLVIVMLYSITDVTIVANFLKKVFLCRFCRRQQESVAASPLQSGKLVGLHSMSTMNMINSPTVNSNMVNSPTVTSNIDADDSISEVENGVMTQSQVTELDSRTDGGHLGDPLPPSSKTFMLSVQGESATSIESAASAVHTGVVDVSTQTVQQMDKAVQTERPKPTPKPRKSPRHRRQIEAIPQHLIQAPAPSDSHLRRKQTV